MKTAAREQPILFSGEMIRALLSESNPKTQTRRVVSANNSTVCGYSGRTLWSHLIWDDRVHVDSGFYKPGIEGFQYLHVPARIPGEPDDGAVYRVRPIYEVGMRLWVRETFRILSFGADVAEIQYADGARRIVSDRKLPNRLGAVPSIFMPRQCSRITLEITEVRAQKIQDISEDDARAEGCAGENCYRHPSFVGLVTDDGELPVEQFQRLWDSINGKKHPWKDNCWVWALSFRRVTG